MFSVSTEAIVKTARIYERVKYAHTNQARLILPKKNPENGVNFPFIKEFCESSIMNDVLTNFYFRSMYADGKKIVPTKPECKNINMRTNLHYYVVWIKNNCADLKDIVNSINKTEENIKMLFTDNSVNENVTENKLLDINSLNRMYPDWIIMLKVGLISPIFLWTNKLLKSYVNFIYQSENRAEYYELLYNKYNKNGKLAQLLSMKFEKYLPESMEEYNKNFVTKSEAFFLQS